MAESLGNVFHTVTDNMQIALQQLEGDVCSCVLCIIWCHFFKMETFAPVVFLSLHIRSCFTWIS